MDVAISIYSGESTGRKANLSTEIFGIEPNDHAIWLDVKSHLANDNSIVLVEDFKFEGPKTKQFLKMLESLGVASQKTLFVIPEANKNIAFSGRNIQNTIVITADQINTYDVINTDKLILVESS